MQFTARSYGSVITSVIWFGYHDRLSGSVIWFGYIARLYRSFTQMPPSLHTIQRRWPGQHSALINRPAPASVIAKLTPDHADSSLTIDAYIEPSIEPALSGTSILFYLGRRLIQCKMELCVRFNVRMFDLSTSRALSSPLWQLRVSSPN